MAASTPACAVAVRAGPAARRTVIATPPVYAGAIHVTLNDVPTVLSTAGTDGTPGSPSGAGSLGLDGSPDPPDTGSSLTHPEAGQLTRVAESASVDMEPPEFPLLLWNVQSEHTRITSVCRGT